MNRVKSHLKSIEINDEYGTPHQLYKNACIKYNIFPTLDVAASDVNHVCKKYYKKENNSLFKQWKEDFFMNPPYSDVLKWLTHAYYQHTAHNVNALILIYAKTDTKFWHLFVEDLAETHFIRGRIKFNDSEGKPSKHNSPYGSAWIIYRKKENQPIDNFWGNNSIMRDEN